MLYAIGLICGLSTPHLNCDEITAHRYERVPGGNELPFMCQRSAEIWAADTGAGLQAVKVKLPARVACEW
jgi:hypothetical protein